jgi:hypothetical protein
MPKQGISSTHTAHENIINGEMFYFSSRKFCKLAHLNHEHNKFSKTYVPNHYG